MINLMDIKIKNLVTFFFTPALLGAFAYFLSTNEFLSGEVVRRQFVNTYVSVYGLVIMLLILITSGLLAYSKNKELMSSIEPKILIKLLILNAILGLFFFTPYSLSHAWFRWTLTRRLEILNINLLISFIPSLILLLFLLRKKFSFRKDPYLYLTLIFWGYIIASLFKMVFSLAPVE